MTNSAPEKYKPDGGFNAGGLPLVIVTLCAAGVGLGWLASMIGQHFYLILLFPMLIGLALAGLGRLAGHVAKMRSPAVAVVLGLLGGAAAVVSMHYFDYLRFEETRQFVLKEFGIAADRPVGFANPKVAEEFAEIKIDDLGDLKQLLNADSFPKYMNYSAEQGVTISSRGQNGFNLGYTGTWIYWGVELLLVAGMAIGGLILGASRPFCSGCNSWKKSRALGTLPKREDAIALLQSGEIDKLREHDPALAGGDLLFTVAVCPNCQTSSPIAVKVEHLTKNKKGEASKTEVAHLVFSGEKLAEFEALFTHRPETTED